MSLAAKNIRWIQPSDVDTVVKLVHELAAFERAPEQCRLRAEQLHAALFCESPALFGHVAELDGQVVGFTLWFLNFSTWRGVHGIYLEDLYVSETHRGHGFGKLLLSELARVCVQRGYARLEWSVLNWNPATEFYRALGAEFLDEWTTNRLTDEALATLAAEAG